MKCCGYTAEDEYSGDIYSPVQQQEQAYDYELERYFDREPEEEMINPVETESMPDETIHGLSERLEQMTGTISGAGNVS